MGRTPVLSPLRRVEGFLSAGRRYIGVQVGKWWGGHSCPRVDYNFPFTMWLLSIDTSSKRPSVALFRDGQPVKSVAPEEEQPQGVAVFQWVERALAEAGITPRDVEAFAVINGPGPFTGLRIGLSLVKGLAEPRRRPVIAVGTLEAVCEAVGSDGLLAPLVDARRGQVFAALYRKQNGELEVVAAPRLLTLEEFLEGLSADGVKLADCRFVSPNNTMEELWEAAFKDPAFAGSALEIISPLLAEAAGRCALRKLASGEAGDALSVKAEYLRRSDAELLWKPR